MYFFCQFERKSEDLMRSTAQMRKWTLKMIEILHFLFIFRPQLTDTHQNIQEQKKEKKFFSRKINEKLKKNIQ